MDGGPCSGLIRGRDLRRAGLPGRCGSTGAGSFGSTGGIGSTGPGPGSGVGTGPGSGTGCGVAGGCGVPGGAGGTGGSGAAGGIVPSASGGKPSVSFSLSLPWSIWSAYLPLVRSLMSSSALSSPCWACSGWPLTKSLAFWIQSLTACASTVRPAQDRRPTAGGDPDVTTTPSRARRYASGTLLMCLRPCRPRRPPSPSSR